MINQIITLDHIDENIINECYKKVYYRNNETNEIFNSQLKCVLNFDKLIEYSLKCYNFLFTMFNKYNIDIEFLETNNNVFHFRHLNCVFTGSFLNTNSNNMCIERFISYSNKRVVSKYYGVIHHANGFYPKYSFELNENKFIDAITQIIH